jgi:hypothetical protein
MQLSDYNILTQGEKEQINEFITQNIETIYDKRYAYGTKIDMSKKDLAVMTDKGVKDEFVDDNFVSYWCNECKNWVKPLNDIGLVEHVLEHIRGDIIENESNTENMAT